MGLTWLFFSTLLVFPIASGQSHQESLQVNLVELEVKVQGIGGEHITGLNKEDFVVKEDGKIQQISHLEEVVPQEESTHVSRQPRIMLLLDLKNTSYPMMSRVFPQLREYVQTRYSGRGELGLALYSNGIIEFLPFTSDQEKIFDAIDRAELFFKNNKLRSYGKPGSPLPSSESENQLYEKDQDDRLYRGFISNHYRYELEVLGQFVRYLGAYSGKKDLVLISENWRTPTREGLETDVDREDIMTLRDIQTVCMYQKVAINTISLARSIDHFGEPLGSSLSDRSKRRASYFSDAGANLAASTSGTYFKISYRKIAETLEKTILKSGHYYLVRYYSDSHRNRFRYLKVSLKGAGRMAFNLDGYYPQRKKVTLEEAKAEIHLSQSIQVNFKMSSNWMHWSWFGWKKRRASYAVSLTAWDTSNQLIGEQIFTGEIFKRKQQGNWPSQSISESLHMNIQVRDDASLVEIKVVDLTSGKTLAHHLEVPDN